MGWPKELVLVRHAESEGNIRTPDERAGFAVGTWKYALTPKGRWQAEQTGAFLRHYYDEACGGEPDVFYTSYYVRAQETMRIMFPNAKVYEDSRLAEAQRGIWHSMTCEEVQRATPYEIERKGREGLYHYRPLGGENWPDVEMRIHSFLGTLTRDYADQRVFMVVHGHWLILFQRLLEHFSIKEALRRYEGRVVPNASVTIYDGIEKNGHSRLILRNPHAIIPWAGYEAEWEDVYSTPVPVSKGSIPSDANERARQRILESFMPR